MKLFEIVATACVAVGSWLWPGPQQPPFNFFAETRELIAQPSREFKRSNAVCTFQSDVARIVETSHEYDLHCMRQKAEVFRDKASRHLNEIDISRLKAGQFAQFFAQANVAECDILNLYCLYALPEFVEFARHLPNYESTVEYFYRSLTYGNHQYFNSVSLSNVFCSLHKEVLQKREQAQTRTQREHWQYNIIHALEQKNSYTDIANTVENSAGFLFKEAERYGAYRLPSEIESPYSYALHAIRHAKSVEEFIINCAFIDHFLCDLHDSIITLSDPGESSIRSRTQDLFIRALKKFVTALNPIHQVGAMCDFFIGTARFVSDMTLGFLYLSPQEHAARRNHYKKCASAFHPSNLAQLTAEQWVDIAAEFAANMVFLRGFSCAVTYLKEVQAIAKANKKAQYFLHSMRNTITTLASENAAALSAESIMIDAKDIGGGGCSCGNNVSTAIKSAIKQAKDTYLPIQAKLLSAMQHEAVRLRSLYGTARRLDGSLHPMLKAMHGKYLKLRSIHIFSIEFSFNSKGLSGISGFHHDFMLAFEKSGALQFVHKFKNECGYYLAEIYEGSRKIDTKSFFPSHFTREQVVETIFEAFDEFITSGRDIISSGGGKTNFIGKTKGGIRVGMWITDAGEIVTAYPILKTLI